MHCEIIQTEIDAAQLQKMFDNTQSIAVIGCSPKPEKDSNKVAKYLVDSGFEMVPVYPKHEQILGQKVYRSLEEIEKKIDMVVVFRKPEVVATVVDAAIKKGNINYLWTQIGIVNQEAEKKAQENGMVTVSNRCVMVEHRNLKDKE